MALDLLTQLSDAGVGFTSRPYPVPGDLRPRWRIGLILLLYDACHGGTATPQQLHILDWVARHSTLHQGFAGMLTGDRLVGESFVRIDPALTRAMSFGSAAGLLKREGTLRTRRTDLGLSLAAELRQHDDLYQSERAFLNSLPRKLSSTAATNMFGTRGNS